MRRTIFSRLTALAIAFVLVLSGGMPVAYAGAAVNPVENEQPEQQSEPVQSVEAEVQERVTAAANDRREEISAEAAAAISETRNALRALDNDNPEEAIAALERATGKLELLLARDPDLGLAPTGVTASTYDLFAHPDTVRQAIALAEEQLEEGNVPEARRVLGMLASEVVVSVSSIPLATYPDAIKKAVPLIDDGSLEAAKGVLQRALNTLVITDYVLPLPLLRAEALLAHAESLAEKAERTEEEAASLSNTLDAVREQIEMAELLGYGSEEEFDTFERQLDELVAKTEQGDSGEGWFDSIKTTLSGLF